MRIAISHIAWDRTEDEAVAALLARHGVDAIDIAPTTYFADPGSATADGLSRVRGWWADRGIEITGMQALLFGAQGLNLFGSPEVQAAMLERLAWACRIGAGVGATRLVFGSPKNRDRTGLTDEQVSALAMGFFRRLGDIAASHGVMMCLEPNPSRYGANFMTTTAETAAMVRQVAHPAIRMQLDTGATTINAEDAAAILDAHSALIGHVHASEPDLVPLGDGSTPHQLVAEALRRHLPGHVVAIEMLATTDEPHLDSIERAIRVAVSHYAASAPAGASSE